MSESTHFPSGRIELPWLDYGGIGTHQVMQEDDTCVVKFEDGWRVTVIAGDGQTECGVMINPPIGLSEDGRCCAPFGHEHPHVWGRVGWTLANISRKIQVNA